MESPSPGQLELIDSHAHLDASEYDGDRAAVLDRARAAGVSTVLTVGIGSTLDEIRGAITLAEQHDWIFAAGGFHPHEAAKASESELAALAELLRHPRVIAWGEIGLDYHYDHSPRDVQARVFAEQLELARAAKLPVIIHCREAWQDCLDILDRDWRSSGLGGILHCFSGTAADAQRGIDMGFSVSFAGNVTFPKSENLREVARALPLSTLLIETDSPYLAPPPHRGRRNEPAFVAEVARTLATVRDLPVAEVAVATANNFRRLFKFIGDSNGPAPGAARREPSHF
ncbi:MAG: TatD family hydrolase [Candidatus Acidiferrales bacterium]